MVAVSWNLKTLNTKICHVSTRAQLFGIRPAARACCLIPSVAHSSPPIALSPAVQLSRRNMQSPLLYVCS